MGEAFHWVPLAPSALSACEGALAARDDGGLWPGSCLLLRLGGLVCMPASVRQAADRARWLSRAPSGLAMLASESTGCSAMTGGEHAGAV